MLIEDHVYFLNQFDYYIVLQRSDELLEEAILSRTLNHLRAHDSQVTNSCTTFIQTLG